MRVRWTGVIVHAAVRGMKAVHFLGPRGKGDWEGISSSPTFFPSSRPQMFSLISAIRNVHLPHDHPYVLV